MESDGVVWSQAFTPSLPVCPDAGSGDPEPHEEAAAVRSTIFDKGPNTRVDGPSEGSKYSTAQIAT